MFEQLFESREASGSPGFLQELQVRHAILVFVAASRIAAFRSPARFAVNAAAARFNGP